MHTHRRSVVVKDKQRDLKKLAAESLRQNLTSDDKLTIDRSHKTAIKVYWYLGPDVQPKDITYVISALLDIEETEQGIYTSVLDIVYAVGAVVNVEFIVHAPQVQQAKPSILAQMNAKRLAAVTTA